MRKQKRTPKSRVRSSLRQLFLRSRERASALKRDGYCCCNCGVKQSKRRGEEVKIEVHHLDENMSWDRIIEYIFRHILCHPDQLETLCKKCHLDKHRRGNWNVL